MTAASTEVECPNCKKQSVVVERVLSTWKYIDSRKPIDPVLLSVIIPMYTCKECNHTYEDEEAATARDRIVGDYLLRTKPTQSWADAREKLVAIIRAREDINLMLASLHIRMLSSYCCDCLTIKIDDALSHAICRLPKGHDSNNDDPHEDLQGGVWWHSIGAYPSNALS